MGVPELGLRSPNFYFMLFLIYHHLFPHGSAYQAREFGFFPPTCATDQLNKRKAGILGRDLDGSED
jgi:hypothetical protein